MAKQTNENVTKDQFKCKIRKCQIMPFCGTVELPSENKS